MGLFSKFKGNTMLVITEEGIEAIDNDAVEENNQYLIMVILRQHSPETVKRISGLIGKNVNTDFEKLKKQGYINIKK